MRRATLLAALLLGLTAGAGESRAEPLPRAELVALDKVTARVTTLQTKVGERLKFRTLVMVVHACDKAPPEEPPESAAFLEIWEEFPGKPSRDLFSGWMFASSPGLNALEHPVYDVWITDCLKSESNSADNADGSGEAGKAASKDKAN